MEKDNSKDNSSNMFKLSGKSDINTLKEQLSDLSLDLKLEIGIRLVLK